MIYITNSTRPQACFTLIPNALISDRRLSSDTKIVLMYLASKPQGWLARVSEIRDALSISDHRWREITAQLKSVHALTIEKRREKTTGHLRGSLGRFSIDQWNDAPEHHHEAHDQNQPEIATEMSCDNVPENDVSHVENQRDLTSATDVSNKRDILNQSRSGSTNRNRSAHDTDAKPRRPAKADREGRLAEKREATRNRRAKDHQKALKQELYDQYKIENPGSTYGQFLDWIKNRPEWRP